MRVKLVQATRFLPQQTTVYVGYEFNHEQSILLKVKDELEVEHLHFHKLLQMKATFLEVHVLLKTLCNFETNKNLHSSVIFYYTIVYSGNSL